jgi:hypothetical protein
MGHKMQNGLYYIIQITWGYFGIQIEVANQIYEICIQILYEKIRCSTVK